MTTIHDSLTKAIAEAREALADIDARGMSFIAAERTTLIDTMRNLIAALDAAQQAPPAAVPAGYALVHVDRMLAACLPGGSSCDPQRVADAIREYVAAQAPPAAVPAGYALVPVEPTQAMLDAAGMCIIPDGKEWLDQSNREVWASMLAAARKGE